MWKNSVLSVAKKLSIGSPIPASSSCGRDGRPAPPVALAAALVVRDFETLARERQQRICLRTEDGRVMGDAALSRQLPRRDML